MWRKGSVVERGPTGAVLDDPQHAYTRLLRESVPAARLANQSDE